MRQAIEQDLFYLDDPAQRQGSPTLFVKGFDLTGKLVQAEFEQLSLKQQFLLRKIFRFREEAGRLYDGDALLAVTLKTAIGFYPDQIENFILNERTNQVKGIYQYAARLTNPHTIAEELATERGEIAVEIVILMRVCWPIPILRSLR